MAMISVMRWKVRGGERVITLTMLTHRSDRHTDRNRETERERERERDRCRTAANYCGVGEMQTDDDSQTYDYRLPDFISRH